jgi:hypothetical protein
MGCGDIIYPAAWLNADEFEPAGWTDYVTPANGFENIFNPDKEDYDYDPVWGAIQGIFEVRQILKANQQQRVKLFLYTPSVGDGNPADWKWIIFLSGGNLPASFYETITNISGISDSDAELFQNTPNPFDQSTQIKYYLPATVKTAFLCIYDLQGVQLKQTTIQERGEGVYTLRGLELKAGIYLYSLIADGQEVDTKRMILTK